MIPIRMKSISAGPEGTKHPGEVHSFPDHEAHALVKGGYGEYTTLQPPEVATVMPSEKAIIEPPEKATIEAKPKGRSKGGAK